MFLVLDLVLVLVIVKFVDKSDSREGEDENNQYWKKSFRIKMNN